MSFQHLVLTPFYLRRQFGDGRVRPLPPMEWLKERLDLFERFCLPTVKAQTNQDFDWLVLFDTDTPPEGLAEFERIVAGYPNVKLGFLDVFTADKLAELVKQNVRPGTDWVLTTRLDNDDGWHEQFVERVQAEVRPGTREFLNFSTGYIVTDDRTYLYRHLSNAFISFSEPVEGLMTPFATNHELLAKLAPVRQIAGAPGFYQLVHGGNFSNKVRGTRVPVAQARQGFETLRYALPADGRETRLAVTIENATAGAVRTARDTAAKLYKRLKYGRPVAADHAG